MFLSWSCNKALWKQRSVQNGFQDQCFQKQRNLGGNSEHWKNIEIQTILKLSMVSRWFGPNAWQGHFATMFWKMFLEKAFQWSFTWFYNVFKIFLLKPFDPTPSESSGKNWRPGLQTRPPPKHVTNPPCISYRQAQPMERKWYQRDPTSTPRTSRTGWRHRVRSKGNTR